MPISHKGKKLLVHSLPPINKGKVYELGSGWGGLSFALAKRFPDLSIIGYEKSPIPYFFSKIRLWLSGQPNLKFYYQDIYTSSLSDASLIVCYLFPQGMNRLKSKLEEAHLEDIYLASYAFQLPNTETHQVIKVKDWVASEIYLYKFN